MSPWERDQETAVEIFNLVELINPHFARLDPQDTVNVLKHSLYGFEDSLTTLRFEGKFAGFMFLSRGRKEKIAQIHGGVHPGMRQRGMGSALFKNTLSKLKDYPQIEKLTALTFLSTEGGPIALERWGFSLIDQVHSSKRDLSKPYPQWAIEKREQMNHTPLRFVTGEELQTLRQDWDRAWWKLDMSTIDIPSELNFEPVSFDLWRAAAQPPLCKLNHTLFVVDDDEPIASLRLGPISQGMMNINFTNVSAEYRRQGISTALKLEAFELAKSLGAQGITTQNHHNNPILDINQRLGFTEVDIIYEYIRDC